jgi:Protein of unknown function (DUF1579)
MRLSRFLAAAAFTVAICAPAVAAAQTSGKQPPPPPKPAPTSGDKAAAAKQEAPPTPKPGPEHAIFKMDVGTWDAEVEIIPGLGQPPMKSKGVEVNTIGCGGLCMISDFKGQAMGAPFHGHGVSTWDAVKKRYTGSWTDSMSQGLQIGEGSWDPANKKFTGTMEGPDMTGKIIKMRSVVEYPAAGKRVMTGYVPGPDGKEMQTLRISYTRRAK